MVKLATGSPCAAASHAHLNLLIKGLKKQEPKPNQQRQALTLDILTKCIRTLRAGYASPATNACLEAMLLLGFFGFLRCAEFTARSRTFNPAIHATMADLAFPSPKRLIFTLKQSKTNQSGPAQQIFLFKLQSEISPYEPLARHVQFRSSSHATALDPLFVDECNKVASRAWFLRHLRLILARTGLDPSNYSGHSLRLGAATSAARSGLPDRVIQQLGRWSSHAYTAYIRSNVADIQNAHSLLTSQI